MFPGSMEIERTVLGCMLLDQTSRRLHLESLTPGMFELEAHKLVLACVQDLARAGTTVDFVTMTERLAKTGGLEKVGGLPFVNELMEFAGTTAGLDWAIERLQEYSVRRDLCEAAKRMAFACRDISQQMLSDLSDMHAAMGGILSQYTTSSDSYTAGQLADLPERKEDLLKVGWHCIDRVLSAGAGGGLPLDQFGVVSGGTSAGKTQFTFNLARKVAAAGVPALYMRTEESTANMRRYLLRSLYREHVWECGRTPSEADYDSGGLKMAQSDAKALPLWVDKASKLSPRQMVAKILGYRQTLGVRFVVIDRLEKLRRPPARREDEQIAALIDPYSDLAADNGIGIIMVCQLHREDPRARRTLPRMEDFKGSSAIEQNARYCLLLHSWWESFRRMAIQAHQDAEATTNAGQRTAKMAEVSRLAEKAREFWGQVAVGVDKQKLGRGHDWGVPDGSSDITTGTCLAVDPEWHWMGDKAWKPLT